MCLRIYRRKKTTERNIQFRKKISQYMITITLTFYLHFFGGINFLSLVGAKLYFTPTKSLE